jgi:hypothetical protein
VRGDGLLHPAAVAGVALLLVNDHYLKHAYPSWMTGKLSDVAGMIFFPLFLQAIVELAPRASRKTWMPSMRLLVACTMATAVVFVAVKLWAPGARLYEHGLGWLQFPFRWVLAGAERPTAVHLVRDLSDLIAVPFVLVAFAIGARRVRQAGDSSLRLPNRTRTPTRLSGHARTT